MNTLEISTTLLSDTIIYLNFVQRCSTNTATSREIAQNLLNSYYEIVKEKAPELLELFKKKG